jgi:hypothetical protein
MYFKPSGRRSFSTISRRGFVRSLCATLPVFSFDQLLAGAGLGIQFVNSGREAGLNAKTIFGAEHKNKFYKKAARETESRNALREYLRFMPQNLQLRLTN